MARLSPCGGGDCCPDPRSCPWHATFARMEGGDPATIHRHQKPSPPFAWQFPAPGDRGEEVCLHLFGDAALDPDMHLRVIDAIRLAAAPSVRFRGAHASNLCQTVEDIIATTPDLPDPLTIDLITPLRLLHGGRPVRTFDPSLFISSLFRRLSSLAAWYGDHPIDADFPELSRLCRMVGMTGSTLRWARWSEKVQGITGSVSLTGVSRELMPFLLAGEYTNAGKGGAWGFGRFRVNR